MARVPASVRNYNPGAQWPGHIASKWGSTGFEVLNDGQGNKIATFPTWEQGAAAHIDLLRQRYSGLPLDKAITKWSGGNFSKEYLDRVTRETGLPANAVISEDLLRSPQGMSLVRSMAGHEKGANGVGVPDDAWSKAYGMVFGGASMPDKPAPKLSLLDLESGANRGLPLSSVPDGAEPRMPAAPRPTPPAPTGAPRMPREQDQQQGLMGTLSNPLVMAGLMGLMSAAGGGDAGAGMSRGMQASSQMQAQQEQARRRAAVNALLQNPGMLGADVPKGLLPIAAATGDLSPVAGFLAKHPEMEMERKRLDLTNRKLEADIAASSRKAAPSFGVIGEGVFGDKQYGWIDPTTQRATPASAPENEASGIVQTPGGQPQSNADINDRVKGALASGKSGEDLLKELPQGLSKQVQAIAEGRVQYPSGFALRQPYWQRMTAILQQYDPQFDAINYNARSKTRADFTSGKSAQNLTAFNTAISHLDTLDKSVDGLGNSNSSLWNSIVNPAKASVDGDFSAKVKEFRTARTAVADELTRAFRGTGGNVHDIVQWERAITEADSPQALRAAIRQATELLHGRIEAVGEQYNRGIGTTRDPMELLTPKARDAMQRLGGRKKEGPAEEAGKAASAATPVAPSAPPPMSGAKQAPDGKWYVQDPARPGKWLMVTPGAQ